MSFRRLYLETETTGIPLGAHMKTVANNTNKQYNMINAEYTGRWDAILGKDNPEELLKLFEGEPVQTHNTQVLVEGEHNGNKNRTKLLTD
jgi:hypothetical protein